MRLIGSICLMVTLLLAAGAATHPGEGNSQKVRVGFVTNGIANFWTIAEAGAIAGANEFDCEALVRMPPSDGGRVANQKRMVEELLSQGVDGIAISPIDPPNQKSMLNEIGDNCYYITHDSDAPDTNRLLYIGMSNYDAGRMCGKLVKQAIPDGGQVVIFIGSLDQNNAKLRRQGVIDEVMGRSHDPSRYDNPGRRITNDQYTILETFVDEFNDSRKKSQPESAIVKYPNLKCMVGLFEYNPPFILEALKSADMLGEVKVVGFDENETTLQAIIDGDCVGTVVQDPYRYGFESVRVLAALARGDKSVLTDDKFLDIPARMITTENVEAFRRELRDRLEYVENLKKRG